MKFCVLALIHGEITAFFSWCQYSLGDACGKQVLLSLDNDLIFHMKSMKILQCKPRVCWVKWKLHPKFYADIVIEDSTQTEVLS